MDLTPSMPDVELVDPQGVFAALPAELLLHIVDYLVRDDHEWGSIAFKPSSPVTRTLHALTLVSRRISPIAFQYLYVHCIHIDGSSRIRRFVNALANDSMSDVQHKRKRYSYINSALLSSNNSENDNVYLVGRTLQTAQLLTSIGSSLRRLVLRGPNGFVEFGDRNRIQRCAVSRNAFKDMHLLEELVIGYNCLQFHAVPPPNLKRLAVATTNLRTAGSVSETYFVPSLEMVVMMRHLYLSNKDINYMFSRYKDFNLDMLLLDVNSNHRTPENTRDWKEDDPIRIWEVDVPMSFYGDESTSQLCEDFFWTQATSGTLWSVEKRRMTSWSKVQTRLSGPVHNIAQILAWMEPS